MERRLGMSARNKNKAAQGNTHSWGRGATSQTRSGKAFLLSWHLRRYAGPEVRLQLCRYLQERHSRQRDLLVQRPWGTFSPPKAILTKVHVPTPALFSPRHRSVWTSRVSTYQSITRQAHQAARSRKAVMLVHLGTIVSPEPRIGPITG